MKLDTLKNRIAELERAMCKQKVTTLAEFVLWIHNHPGEPCPGGDAFVELIKQFWAGKEEQKAREIRNRLTCGRGPASYLVGPYQNLHISSA